MSATEPAYRTGFCHGILMVCVPLAILALLWGALAIREGYSPHHAIDAYIVGLHPGRFNGRHVSVCGHAAAIEQGKSGYTFLLCDRGAQIIVSTRERPMLYDGIDGEEVSDGEWVGVEGIYSYSPTAASEFDGTLSKAFIYDMNRAYEDAEAARTEE